MKNIALLIASLLFFISCNSGSQSQPNPNAKGVPAPTASSTPESTPSTLQPPYPIADSSDYLDVQGMKIYVVEEGKGAKPKPGSHVIINYRGTLLDGTVFDESFSKKGIQDFSLGSLIRGWQIGLTQVPTGSKVKLIVPPELGYGSQSRSNIPANSTLIFDIELVSSY
ncbi:MAG: FKBP-type peptidyl-prolyl cis-trans isomerase [Bacteroidota bacterium]